MAWIWARFGFSCARSSHRCYWTHLRPAYGNAGRMNMATILIVDDYDINRELLVTLLGYRSHRLLEATDGLEALTLSRSERPDLAIADILMPTMDGYEFVRQLRADPT